MHIFIGADHRGYDLGKFVYEKLKANPDNRVELVGLGKKNDDYVDIAYQVADSVKREGKDSRGILLCGSGAGVDMVANKVSGVRCALTFDKERAIQAREHEDANMIALPADVLEQEQTEGIVQAFLETPFSNQSRHVRRLKKIEMIERTDHPLLVLPGILATHKEDFESKLKEILESEYTFTWIQIDIMDQIFVQNQSILPEDISGLEKFEVEAQLMVAYPSQWISRVIKAGAKRVVFPIESEEDAHGIINELKLAHPEVQIGISLNPETPVEQVLPYLEAVDLVLFMSVHPGFSGQVFVPSIVDKVRELRKELSSVVIEVDGGITPAVAKRLVDAGANNLVISSHLLEGDIDENLEKVWQAIED